ncbi:MAG: hypothetical protein ACYC3A_11890 [Halothiobacillus sp.]
MSNLSGFGLTSRLITKHFGNLGDSIASAIAGFDPETATEADRDALADKLRGAAQKLGQARADFNKEHQEAVSLQSMIDSDTALAKTFADKLTAGTMTEAQVNLFLDELDANKARLPQEQQQEADAKSFMDELQTIVDALSSQLAAFDDHAKAAMQALARAKAEQDMQAMRLSQQATLNGLKGMSGSSTALDALTKKAQAISAQAEGDRIVADIGQRQTDHASEIDAIRKRAAAPQTQSTADRLARLG